MDLVLLIGLKTSSSLALPPLLPLYAAAWHTERWPRIFYKCGPSRRKCCTRTSYDCPTLAQFTPREHTHISYICSRKRAQYYILYESVREREPAQKFLSFIWQPVRSVVLLRVCNRKYIRGISLVLSKCK